MELQDRQRMKTEHVFHTIVSDGNVYLEVIDKTANLSIRFDERWHEVKDIKFVELAKIAESLMSAVTSIAEDITPL